MSRTDRLQTIGLSLLIVAFAAANTLFDIAAGAEGPWRMLGLSGVFVVGLVGMWSLRSPALALGLLVASALVGVVILYFRIDRLAFELLTGQLVWPLAVWMVTWAIVRLVMPRLDAARPWAALLLGGLLFVLHLGVAIKVFTPANAFFQLHRVEPVRDLETLVAMNRIRREGHPVVALIEGRIGSDLADGVFVREFNCRERRRGLGYTRPVRGNSRLFLELVDGERLRSTGAAYNYRAVDWPETGDGTSCGLQNGDPVVVWAEIGAGVEGPVEDRQTRIMAYGDIDAFRAGYAARAEFAARMVGGVAFLLALTGLVPLVAGVLAWRRLRRQASA
jgi:hypothetical protein